MRDRDNAYGFAAFEVDPGTEPGGRTSMRVTYYAVAGASGGLTPADRFTMIRSRRDGWASSPRPARAADRDVQGN
ncbi:hypothetical protein [Micromonospora zhanjiangensis]|uniref:Uncharacterized protein n=1 Tax=Micromonospora zhanjiangensis TaxID=1522057 RepID=A0ABV8KPA2_9ACTN